MSEALASFFKLSTEYGSLKLEYSRLPNKNMRKLDALNSTNDIMDPQRAFNAFLKIPHK